MKPFAVSTTLSLASGSIGNTPANMNPLRNPYDKGYYLDEIILAPLTLENQWEVQAQFNWLGQELVRDNVPFFLLGPQPVLRQRFGNWHYQDKIAVVWKLPKPLFIPAGETLVPKLRHSGQTAAATIATRIIYKGRSLEARDPVPKVAAVPWASGMIGASRLGGDATSASQHVEQSTATDFMNPHPEPLNVTHFMGSVYRYTGTFYVVDSPAPLAQDVTVRIISPEGEIMVRDASVFQQVFYRREWKAQTVLGSKEYFTVIVDEDLRDRDVTEYNDPIRVAVSMVGYREVTL